METAAKPQHSIQMVSPAPAALVEDPFDPATLRLSQNFGADLGVKKALLTIPVRKPDKQWFLRVHPDPSYRLNTAVLELKDDNETYLVAPTLWSCLQSEVIPKALFTAINRQGVLFLLPIRLPGLDGRIDAWNQSLMAAAEMATKEWVRVAANRSLGAYEIFEATSQLPEPVWPEVSHQEILRIAFKGRYLDSYDHRVLRRLRGEV